MIVFVSLWSFESSASFVSPATYHESQENDIRSLIAVFTLRIMLFLIRSTRFVLYFLELAS